MNDIQQNKLVQLGKTLRQGAKLHASFYGHTIRIEELEGSHLLRSMLLHPSQGDSLRGVILDASALLREECGLLLHAEGKEAKEILGR